MNEPVVLLQVNDVEERLFAQVARICLVRSQVIRHARRHVNSFLVRLQRSLIHKRPSALIARMLRMKYARLEDEASLFRTDLREGIVYSHLTRTARVFSEGPDFLFAPKESPIE